MWFACPKCGEDCNIPMGLLATYFCVSGDLMCFQCGNVSPVTMADRLEYVCYVWRN